MPDLNHLWQRFLLTSSLIVGLLVGVGATVFGYSNLATVNVRWSVFHIDGVPLWTVAIVPLALVLIAGTLYHWMDGLHHFTEHMRHRRRVHELEAEVASLREHLDQVLEMPDHSAPIKARVAALPVVEERVTALVPAKVGAPIEPAAEPAAQESAPTTAPKPAVTVAALPPTKGQRNDTNGRRARKATQRRVILAAADAPKPDGADAVVSVKKAREA